MHYRIRGNDFAKIYRLGISIDRGLYGSSISALVNADRRFDAEHYVLGFHAFARYTFLKSSMTSLSDKGISAFLQGVALGERGKFFEANAAFRRAHEFATAEYPFQDSLYFLAVTDIALAQRDKAFKTLCYALPLTYHRPGDATPSLEWNFLIANRIAKLSGASP